MTSSYHNNFIEDTNLPILSSIVEYVIKSTYIFIILALCPWNIKVFPKLDIIVIWMDIWNSQSSSNTKMLINRYFNFGSHIAMIHSTNMNPEVLQCKNYKMWGHTTFTCWAYGTKCPKYNRPHRLEHYRNIAWCYKCCSNHSPEQHLWYTDFSKALSRLSSSRDYKRTRQGALAALLLYLYKLPVVHATTISTCPNVYALSSCPITHPP